MLLFLLTFSCFFYVLSVQYMSELAMDISSHVEVVLVGRMFSSDLASKVSRILERFSDISSKGFHSDHVRERLIYHVKSEHFIEKQLSQIIASSAYNVVDPSDVESILSSFHEQSSTLTTLFIISELDQVSYRYKSSLHNSCEQNTFISSRAGFAWIDLSRPSPSLYHKSNYSGLSRPSNILPIPSMTISNITHDFQLIELASLIHRSAEAIVPLPIGASSLLSLPAVPGEEFGLRRQFSQVEGVGRAVVHLLVISICLHITSSVSPCTSDPNAVLVADKLVRMYSTTRRQLFTSEIVLSVDDPAVKHAIDASTYHSGGNGSDELRLNSQQLLRWLGASGALKDVLSRTIDSTSTKSVSDRVSIFPVFSFSALSNGSSVVFDDDGSSMALAEFMEPSGGWGVQRVDSDEEEVNEALEIASRLLWPQRAVLVATGSLFGPPHGHESPIICNGRSIPLHRRLFVESMLFTVREGIWGLHQPYEYFSRTSKMSSPSKLHGPGDTDYNNDQEVAPLVTDFLWAYPSLSYFTEDETAVPDSTGNFREVRALPRLELFSRADDIIRRFLSLVRTAYTIVPHVDVPSLLSATTISGADDGFLSKFKTSLSEAARLISNLQYDAADSHLSEAAAVTNALKQRLREVVVSRTGRVVCNVSTNENVMKASQRHTEGGRGIKSTGRGRGIHYWKWVFFIVGAVMGILLGVLNVLGSMTKKSSGNFRGGGTSLL